jgi:hypothetical protein
MSNVISQSPNYKEPTKTLRGALALVSRRKLLHQIPRPIEHDRMIDLTTVRWKVNGASENKRVLFE